MSDLISRSAAISEIEDWMDDDSGDEFDRGYDFAMKRAIRILKKIPAVDAVPVAHARWTEDRECTRCGCTAEYTEYATERYDYDWDENLVPCGIEYHRTYHTTDYCPTCGARMDGEEHAAD